MKQQHQVFYELIMQSAHVGSLPGSLSGQAGQLGQSDVVQFFAIVEDAQIKQIKFQAQGAAATLAAAAWLADKVMQQAISVALAITVEEMIDALQLKRENANSALLAIDALQKTLGAINE